MVAFVHVLPARRGCARRCASCPRAALFGEAAQAAAQNYFADLAVLHKYIGLTPGFAKFEHPVLMGVSIALLAGFGSKLGFQAQAEGLDSPKRTTHATLMASLLVIALGGFGGGTLSNAMVGREVWLSPHSYTAVLVLGLLLTNAALAGVKARALHANVGKAALAALAIHTVSGIVLLASP